MKLFLITVIAITLVMSGCVKLAGEQVDNQSSGDNAGLAQNPGDMQALPGAQSGSSGNLPSLQPQGQSGSLGGFNQPSSSAELPAGQPVSPAMGQFNLPGQGASQPSSSGDATSSNMAGFLPSSQSGDSDLKPFFEKDGNLYVDTDLVDVGESVFLGWRVSNADEFTLDWGSKNVITIPGDRIGTFVIPDIPGTYKYTLTAKNAGGSISQTVEVMALSKGQRTTFNKYNRCRTFKVYPQKIKKGEPVYVYWNVLDAQNVFLENDFTSTLSGKPDMRDIVQTYGMEQYWPYQDTTFQLTHGDGTYSETSYGASICFVEVR